jgi:hypothetical protein
MRGKWESNYNVHFGRDNSVGIATGYGLDCSGSIPGKGKIVLFSVASTPALGPTQPIQWVLGAPFSGIKRQGVKLTTYLHLVRRSEMVELYLHYHIRLHRVMLNKLSIGTTCYIQTYR